MFPAVPRACSALLSTGDVLEAPQTSRKQTSSGVLPANTPLLTPLGQTGTPSITSAQTGGQLALRSLKVNFKMHTVHCKEGVSGVHSEARSLGHGLQAIIAARPSAGGAVHKKRPEFLWCMGDRNAGMSDELRHDSAGEMICNHHKALPAQPNQNPDPTTKTTKITKQQTKHISEPACWFSAQTKQKTEQNKSCRE